MKKPLLFGALGLYLLAVVVSVGYHSPPAQAQVSLGTSGIYEPFAFEQVTVGASATGLTAGTYAPGGGQISARSALCTVETQSVRLRIQLYTRSISQARFIRATGADGLVSCTYAR